MNRQFLKQRITQKFGIPCYDPANGETVVIQTSSTLPIDISTKLLKRQIASLESISPPNPTIDGPLLSPPTKRLKESSSKQPIHGVLVFRPQRAQQVRKTRVFPFPSFTHTFWQSMVLLHPSEASEDLGLTEHKLRFSSSIPLPGTLQSLSQDDLLSRVFTALHRWIDGQVQLSHDSVSMRSIAISKHDHNLLMSWSYEVNHYCSLFSFRSFFSTAFVG